MATPRSAACSSSSSSSSSTSQLSLVDYSPKCLLLRGPTFPHKTALRAMGGRWNKTLKGWVFSKKTRAKELSAWLAKVQPAAASRPAAGGGGGERQRHMRLCRTKKKEEEEEEGGEEGVGPLQATRLREGRRRVNYDEDEEEEGEEEGEEGGGGTMKKKKRKMPSRRVTWKKAERGEKGGREDEDEDEEEEEGGDGGSSDDSNDSWSEGDEEEDGEEEDEEEEEGEEAYEGESDDEEDDEEGWDEDKVYSVFTTTARQRAAAAAAVAAEQEEEEERGGGGKGKGKKKKEASMKKKTTSVPASDVMGTVLGRMGSGMKSPVVPPSLTSLSISKPMKKGGKGKTSTLKHITTATKGTTKRKKKIVVEEEADFPELLPSSSPSSSLRQRHRGRNPRTGSTSSSSSSSLPSSSSSSSPLLLLPQDLFLSALLPFLTPQPDYLHLSQTCSPLLLLFDRPSLWATLPLSLPPFNLRYSSLSLGRTARGRVTQQPMDIVMLKLMKILNQTRFRLLPSLDLRGMELGAARSTGKGGKEGGKEGGREGGCPLLNYVLEKCPKVERLWLQGPGDSLSGWANGGVERSLEGVKGQLTELGLEVKNIYSLKQLVASCPRLERLSLGGNHSRDLTAQEWEKVWAFEGETPPPSALQNIIFLGKQKHALDSLTYACRRFPSLEACTIRYSNAAGGALDRYHGLLMQRLQLMGEDLDDNLYDKMEWEKGDIEGVGEEGGGGEGGGGGGGGGKQRGGGGEEGGADEGPGGRGRFVLSSSFKFRVEGKLVLLTLAYVPPRENWIRREEGSET